MILLRQGSSRNHNITGSCNFASSIPTQSYYGERDGFADGYGQLGKNEMSRRIACTKLDDQAGSTYPNLCSRPPAENPYKSESSVQSSDSTGFSQCLRACSLI